MNSQDLSVLMLSLDPGLLNSQAGTGNALERHTLYADRVKSLDIVVFAGLKQHTTRINDRLNIHATGVSGVANLWKARKIAQQIISENKVHLIVTQDPHGTGQVGLGLKKKYRIPLLVDCHGDFINNSHWKKESLRNRIFSLTQKKVLFQADALRVTSRGLRDSLVSIGMPESRISVINTPINDRVFTSINEEQQILLEKLQYKYRDKKVLIFAGRLVAAKNLLFTLKVITELKKRRSDFLFFIIGDGEERGSLESFVQKEHLESQVQFLGVLEPVKIAVYYRLALASVLFSTNDSFGKTIIEAGLSKTTCLASATTGARSIIDDGKTGLLVPINDFQSSVDVLYEMLEYPEDTRDLGVRAGQIYSERYAESVSIDAIISLWSKTGTV